MASTPVILAKTPKSWRKWAKARFRPYALRFFEAYSKEYASQVAVQGQPEVDPANPFGANEYRFATEMMASAFADGKHCPVRPFQKNYVIPKQDPGTQVWSDGLPIPPKHLWVGYGETPEQYLWIGKANVEKVREVMRNAGRDMQPGDRILDLGCAAGPQLRNLKEFAETGEVWGVDIDGEHVTWCIQHLSPPFRFALTTTSPHLPFEDHYFDSIYCGSVFSHIGEMADAWLLELARIIRPGGYLYLTMNTKQSLKDYLEKWPALGFSQEVLAGFTKEQIDSDFATMVVNRSPWMHSIYDLDFFLRKCDAMFEVASVNPNAYSFQTALLLERKDKSRRPSLSVEAGRAATQSIGV